MSGEQSIFLQAKLKLGIGSLLNVDAHPVRWKRLKECPLCGGKFTFSFTDERFTCWSASCAERGDVVELAAKVWSMSPYRAACEIVGARDDVAKRKWSVQPKRAPDDLDADLKRLDTIGDILAGAVPARGTIVETYLQSRGIAPADYAGAIEHVLFNPRAIYFEANHDRGAVRKPAMIMRVVRDRVETGGIHCTYLRADGRGKTKATPAKKMWGPQADAQGRPGGLLLLPPKPGGLLVVAEGFENALTVAGGRDAGAFAAGSLDRMQGGMALDAWGRADWREPAPNEDRPAATIRHDGPVLLVLDGDMQPLTLDEGKPWQRTISARKRAQVCGLLAAHWWRKAGATDVRTVLRVGSDANDLLREEEGVE